MSDMRDAIASTPRRRPGRTSLAADPRSRQARRSFRRNVPHHRHHAFQLHQLRSAPRLRSHPIQSAQPQSPHPLRLVSARWARRIHRSASAADARFPAVVSRHRRRRVPEHLFHRQRALQIRLHPLRRSHLQDELQPHAQAARRFRRGRHCGHHLKSPSKKPPNNSGSSKSTRTTASSASKKSPLNPKNRLITPDIATRQWASTFSTPT